MMAGHPSRLLVVVALLVVSCESDGGPSILDGSSTDVNDAEAWTGDAAGDTGGDAAGDTAGDASTGWVGIVEPTEGSSVDNPVTFVFETGGDVLTVAWECEGWPLHDGTLAADAETFVYDFTGVNFERHVLLTGYDVDGAVVDTDEVRFTPVEPACAIAGQPGFNHYTVSAINDAGRFPKDGTYPYCWEYHGDVCGDVWGQIHDGLYGGQLLFPGGGDCFCSGHTLEIFLAAYRLWREESGLGPETLFSHMGSTLDVDSVDLGDFYQRWQGFGVASTASSADAFEHAGIGENLWQERWDEVLPGDFVNLSRSTGGGHAVIFVDWLWEAGERVGLRYYGCNGSGQSCPDPEDPENTWDNSGPSFATEYFDGHGGAVLPAYLFIGRVWLPVSG
jgi:hypothetical protein